MVLENRDLKIIRCGNTNTPDDWLYWTNKSSIFDRIYYPFSDNAGYVKNSKKVPFTPFNLYYIPAGSNTEFYIDEDTKLYHFYIDFVNISPYISDTIIKIDTHTNKHIQSFINCCTDFLTASGLSRFDTSDLKTTSKVKPDFINTLTSIVTTLLYFINDIEPFNQTNLEALIPAINHIRHHYGDEINLDELVELTFFSKNHFIRKFTATFGVTPYQYVKRLRMNIAVSMLKNGVKCSKIYDKVGYKSVTAFSIAFKKYFGISPSDI